jgi:hypothetical protein
MSNKSKQKQSRDLVLPLYLHDSITLADLNTKKAFKAIEHRHHAFHEVGHGFAAYLESLEIGTLTVTRDSAQHRAKKKARARLAATPLVVQGVLNEADVWRHGGQDLDSEFIDERQFLEHVECILDDTKQTQCCCRRGGDTVGYDLLRDDDWVITRVNDVIDAWPAIEALAVRLMHGEDIDGAEAREDFAAFILV